MRRRLTPAFPLAMAILLATGLAMAASPGAHAQTSSGNLILNGNATVGLCSTTGLDTMTEPGWTITSGGPDSVCYGSPGGYPSHSTTGASSSSNAFFAGGSKGGASTDQVVNVSSASSAINAGGVTFDLSGNLGGYSSQADRVGVVATFENSSGSSLGTADLPAVTASERHDTTEFLAETATGTVPEGTTQVLVTVTWTLRRGQHYRWLPERPQPHPRYLGHGAGADRSAQQRAAL
jgi:hypothetical protein